MPQPDSAQETQQDQDQVGCDGHVRQPTGPGHDNLLSVRTLAGHTWSAEWARRGAGAFRGPQANQMWISWRVRSRSPLDLLGGGGDGQQ